MENAKDDSNSPVSFRRSIEEFGNVYESIFQTAMKLCFEMNLLDESKIAAKKIISYNPSNQELAETFPEYEKVAQFISHLILNKIQLLTGDNDNDNIVKNQNHDDQESFLHGKKKGKDLKHQSIQNLNENESIIQKNSKKVSTSSIPWNILGHCYLLLGDFPNAFASLSQFFQIKYNGSYDYQPEIEPLDKNFLFWFSFGIVSAHYKYHDNAIKCFQIFIKFVENFDNTSKITINENNIPYQTLFEMKNEAIFRMAISYRHLNLYNDSLKLFYSITSVPPNNLKTDDILFQIAYTHQIMNKFTEAQNIYNDIYQNCPDNITIMTQFGWALITHYMFDNKNNISFLNEGLRLLLEALDRCQTDPLVLFLLGKTMMIKEDYQAAYSYFKNCINFWTDSTSFWCDFGVLYCKNKQYQDALVAFQRAVYLSQDLIEAWLNLGTVFEKMGQYLNAKKIYLTAKSVIKSDDKDNSFDERIEMLQDFENNKSHTVDNDVIYLKSDHDFTQLPLEFSNNYLAAVPRILLASLGVSDDQPDINLEVLSSYPKSMF